MVKSVHQKMSFVLRRRRLKNENIPEYCKYILREEYKSKNLTEKENQKTKQKQIIPTIKQTNKQTNKQTIKRKGKQKQDRKSVV